MGPIFLRFIETKYIVRGQTGMDQGLKSRFINAELMRWIRIPQRKKDAPVSTCAGTLHSVSCLISTLIFLHVVGS